MADDILLQDPRSGATARVAPQLGFNCYSFQPVIHGVPREVLDSPADTLTNPPRPSGFGIPILFPFPNRIRAGQFTWAGAAYDLTPTGRGNASHGFCHDRPWRVSSQTANSVTGEFQLSVDRPDRRDFWPADFRIEVRYAVSRNRLESQFRITNPDHRPLPWGLGTHAYFKLPFSAESSAEKCVYEVPVSEEWVLDNFLPTGERRSLPADHPLRRGVRFGTQRYDHVFTGWKSDAGQLRCSIIDEGAGIELAQVCDGDFFREAVVYTPQNRNAVCIEPYTCVTDAINLHAAGYHTGLRTLLPGAAVQTWIEIDVRPLTV